jgi:hypothetical protein
MWWYHATSKPSMAFTIHGIGMMVYGERDYWPDGSFVTTEWFVLAWVPIIPICSKRISYTRNSDYATYDANDGFYVYETMGVDRLQAFFVYLWIASVLAPIIVWAVFQEALAKIVGDEDRAAGLCLLSSAIAFVTPYFLRRRARKRKEREWERARLGLG